MPTVNADPSYRVQAFSAQPPGALLVAWGEGLPGKTIPHAGIVRNGKFVANFAASSDVAYVTVGAWLDDHRALGNIEYSVPALIDFASGEVRPIEIYGPIFDLRKYQETFPGRNFIIGFARP